MNDERYAFYEDVRERSLSTGRRAARWGGGVVMPSEYTKFKRWEKNSKVKTTKYLGMYWNDFLKLTKNEQAEHLRTWAKDYTPSEIAEHLGCKTTSIIPLIKYFKITYAAAVDKAEQTEVHVMGMTYEQFKKLSYEERISTYNRLTENMSQSALSKAWGLGPNVLYALIYDTRKKLGMKQERTQGTERIIFTITGGVGQKVEQPSITGESIVQFVQGLETKVKALEAENERLKLIESKYEAIMNALKGVTA